MRNSKNTLALLIAILGVAVLAFTYVYGVAAINSQTDAVASENRNLKLQADAYEMLYVASPEYAKKSEEMKAEFASLQSGFIAGISTEDEIIYMAEMEDKNADEQLVLSYITMGSPSVIYYQGSAAESNAAFATGAISMPSVSENNVTVYSYPIDYGFSVTYKGFKDMIAYLNTQGTKKQINAVSLSFDNSTGILNGILSVNELVMYGTDMEYNELTIPHVPVTVENIFGTIEITDGDGAEAEPKND